MLPPLDLSGLAVMDGHCHPLLPDPWTVSVAQFLDRFSEGRPGAMAAHVRHTGYFARTVRDLARRLGCEATAEAVLARRRALGLDGVRRLIEGAGVAALLVDTGYPPDAMGLDEMRAALPCAIHEVWRIETCAQSLLPRALRYPEFVEAFRAELRAAARRAVALKSIIAYRSGLAIARWAPEEAARAYAGAVERVRHGGSPRLAEKPLLDTLFEVALDVCRETGRPLQVHAGFGDPDIDLPRANPTLLRPILEDDRGAGVRIAILHMAYPYFREAAFMAAVWPQVFVDLSLALPFLGPGAAPAVAEMLSLAPASKLMYGSDVGGLPELFALSADWGRAALAEALGWLVERDGLTRDEARAAARRILSENAVALYGIDGRVAPR
jgi:predicted TIM-barrel fold metal-dependent hydrolase